MFKSICSKVLLLVFLSGYNNWGKAQIGNFPYYNTLSATSSEVNLIQGQGNSTQYVNGALQLTDNNSNRSGAAFLSGLSFPSTYGIHIEFEFASFGGNNNADGLAMILMDAQQTPTAINGVGASLGYTYYRRSNNLLTQNGTAGITGGYLAIGLDEWGNFKQELNGSSDSRNGIPSGTFGNSSSQQFRNHISVRGAAGKNFATYNPGLSYTLEDAWWGYPLLFTCRTDNAGGGNISAALNTQTGTYDIGTTPIIQNSFTIYSNYENPNQITWNASDANYRKAVIDVFPTTGGYNISVKVQHGSYVENVLKDFFYPSENPIKYQENGNDVAPFLNLNTTPPQEFTIGFTASTGSYSNYHYIHNLSVTLPAAAVSKPDSAYCPIGESIAIPVLDNDEAYKDNPDLTSTAAKENIDLSSFSFTTSSFAQSISTPVTTYEAQDTGTWAYNVTDGTVSFTPVSGFSGDAILYYSIKSAYSPYDAEFYRSQPASIKINVPAKAVARPDSADLIISNSGNNYVDLSPIDNDGALGRSYFSGNKEYYSTNIDLSSFCFTDASGNILAQNYYTQPRVGTWSYDNGTLQFTPIAGFTGKATIYYSINGKNVQYDGKNYFSSSYYRSNSTYCTVNVKYNQPYFPSAFTPNDDQLNDVFKPLGNAIQSNGYMLQIFNRWGQLLFTSHDPAIGWNGYYNNIPQSAGTYVWSARFILNGTSEIEKGTLVLIR